MELRARAPGIRGRQKMAVESPDRVLEKQLRRAIMQSLHELVPEFRAHVGECASCAGFHDWLVWRHQPGTHEWHAKCPSTGAALLLPFELADVADAEDAGESA